MIFEAIQSHAPEKTALQDAARSVCYGDLVKEVDKRAQKLENVSVLGIALDNGVEWVLWDLAALKAGVPCVPLPPFFTQDQVFHVLRRAGVSHLVSSEGINATGISLAGQLPEGTAKITFTSGTTAEPKGVCLPKAAMENVASSIVSVLGGEFVGTHACLLPLSVLLENVAGVYAGLMAGCTVRLAGLQDIGASYGNVHNCLKGATSAICVPEILRILMGQTAAKGPLPDLKFIAVGGAKVDPSLIEKARAMGLPVYEGYGLSECASVVSLNTPKEDKPGSAGKLLPHVRACVTEGEIRIEAPGFLGYIGEKAPQTLSTGDLGEIDGNGFLTVTGRKKNVLITSYGRNVSPEWVEAALLAQAPVGQALVYGDAQAHLSALIVPSSPEADIREAVYKANAVLPDYARIEDFQVVPPFTVEAGTLTGTGRPRRNQILTLYAKETEKDELLRQAG